LASVTIAPPVSVEEGRRRVLDLLGALPPGGVVALSGGADSALVLDLAVEAWGPARVVAATSRSESLAPEELADARRLAERAGVDHVVLPGSELAIDAFRRNEQDRCFHCKDSLFGQMADLARERGLPQVLDGTNADDLDDWRPGLAAARTHGVVSPLVGAGITKPWVRAISRDRGLFTWDKPADACLSSRFPYGTEVTAEGLDRVRRAERVLKDLGFRSVRVRVHDPVARIEVPPEDLPALLAPGVRERAIEGVKAAGFHFVALDLEGYRSGSLNDVSPAGDPRPPP
jgi:uncharacterized protein